MMMPEHANGQHNFVGKTGRPTELITYSPAIIRRQMQPFVFVSTVVCALLVALVRAQHDPHFLPGRSVIVVLFEWPFRDIARECEQFLGPHGFAAVQTSVPTEHVLLPGRPWWQRYQPISYKIDTQLGNGSAFRDMADRCRANGVRVYVDVVINHMAGEVLGADDQRLPMIGSAGSLADIEKRSFPEVPYSDSDFHASCPMDEWWDAHVVRNCESYNIPDLDQSREHVRERIASMLSNLVALGAAGFRVGSCKFMWPNDLKQIYARVRGLGQTHGFAEDERRPFIYQDVGDKGQEPVSKTEYTFVGLVGEIGYTERVGLAFSGRESLGSLCSMGPATGLVHSDDAIVFIETHDTQREPLNETKSLSFRTGGQAYKSAVAFMLAHDYGVVRLMSSYDFGEDTDVGPPLTDGRVRSPFDEQPEPGERRWLLEHRSPLFVNMIEWRRTVGRAPMRRWRTINQRQVAFCRGERGFVAFNAGEETLKMVMAVCVPPGVYCDVAGRGVDRTGCERRIHVDSDGSALIEVEGGADGIGVLAIHVNAMAE